MTNSFYAWHKAEYVFDGLAIAVGLLLSIPCFLVLTAPLWSGQ